VRSEERRVRREDGERGSDIYSAGESLRHATVARPNRPYMYHTYSTHARVPHEGHSNSLNCWRAQRGRFGLGRRHNGKCCWGSMIDR